MTVLAAALDYAGHGWPVFVLSPSKVPVRNCEPCRTEHTAPADMEACPCLMCHGFYAATTDPDRVAAMVDRHPAGCLAVRTGAVSGTVVVDVDGPTGLRTMARLDEAKLLPGTVMAMTGGGGLHLVYAHPGVRVTSGAGRLGPGIDVKADDAYVVVAPSVHPKTHRSYVWAGGYRHRLTELHPALTRRLRARPAPTVPGHPHTSHHLSRVVGGTPEGRLGGLVKTVLRAPLHERNTVLHWATCRAGEMVAAGEIDEADAFEALRRAGLEVGLTPAEIGATPDRGTIGSGLRKGTRGPA